MADQRRVFDVAHALAVVVDDGHLAAFFQNVLAFHKTNLICIHHDAQGALGDDGQGVLGVDEVILLPCLAQRIDQAGRQRSVSPDGDDRRHIADLTNAQHTLGCADGIQIAHAVTHDDHMVGLLDQLDQLVGHKAAAHLTALFHAVAHAAIEGKAVQRHLSGLIAAASLRHIQCVLGHILRLPQGARAASDTNGH